MRYGKSGFCGLVYLIALSGPSVAQNDLINIFGGLARSGIAMATQSAWEKLPSSEIACIDQTLRQRGSSINLVIQQAIGPSDARIFDVRSACRNQLTEQSPRLGPSFDCAKATFADERAICSNSELSQLDNVVTAAHRYVRDQSGEQAARSISGPSLQFRRACNADVTCIKQVQIFSIRDYQNRGAPISYSETAPARPLSVHPEYVVDGLSLGANVQFNSVSYREYRCRPSEQFAGFAFCQKQREQREARGPYTASNTILHSADGTAVYINRYLEPAFFDGDEAKADISRLSKKLGSPHVIPMPANSDVPNGMIVSWGNVVLESLDPAALKDLAEGKDVRAGFMIDHIGNLRRSARTGLPIYRLRGAAGYVWAASWNANGRGTLQFLTIDASIFANEAASVPSDLPKSSSDTSDAKKPVAGGTSGGSSRRCGKRCGREDGSRQESG